MAWACGTARTAQRKSRSCAVSPASIATTASSRLHRATSKSCATSTNFTGALKTIPSPKREWPKRERSDVKFFAVLLIVLATWVHLWAQTKRCDVGVQAPPVGFWVWPAGSQIKVYVVESDFQPGEVSHLLTPLASWNAVSELTGSRVKFEYAGTVMSAPHCENCLTIERGAVFDKRQRHLTELRAYSARGDRILSWASIVIDPALTNPSALTDAVAHELGHNFGLLDCYSCKTRATVMNQFGPVNSPNNLPGPTACDVAQVKLAYKQLTLQTSRTAPAKTLPDEGEEPVDDDTPIVVPKP